MLRMTVCLIGVLAAMLTRPAGQDEKTDAAPVDRFELKDTYENAEELQQYLKHFSSWPVYVHRNRQAQILFYSTMWFPDPQATSYVLARVDADSGVTTVLDSGFFWQTAKNTRLDKIQYDHDKKIVYYLDDYDMVLGGRILDLGVTESDAVRDAIPKRDTGR